MRSVRRKYSVNSSLFVLSLSPDRAVDHTPFEVDQMTAALPLRLFIKYSAAVMKAQWRDSATSTVIS
jgi:hypothetical protein